MAIWIAAGCMGLAVVVGVFLGVIAARVGALARGEGVRRED